MNIPIRTLRIAVMGAAILTLTACANKLTSSFDSVEAQRLDNFQTYAWLGNNFTLGNTQSPEVANPINEGRIRKAINEELAQKGYRLVDRADADFIVSAAIGANDQIQIRDFYRTRDFGFAGIRGSRFGRGFGHSGGALVQNYTEGVLVLNVFENLSKEAVWHGAASKRLSREFMAPELIDEAAAALLDEFPDSLKTNSVLTEESMSNQMLNDKVVSDRMS